MRYRFYISDALMYISESTAKFAGGHYLKERYHDQIKPKKKGRQSTQSGQDIAANLISSLAGKGGS